MQLLANEMDTNIETSQISDHQQITEGNCHNFRTLSLLIFCLHVATIFIGVCNWCGHIKNLLEGKKFCHKCSLVGRECRYCHRPMPERFYTLHKTRCNSCYKKHQKLNDKRRHAAAKKKQKKIDLRKQLLQHQTQLNYEKHTPK